MTGESSSVEVFSVLSSNREFTGRIVKVRVDDVLMPGGNIAKREVVEHDRAVAIAALDDSGNLVMVEHYRHPLRRRLWELPAGLMDIDGESALTAAQRELAEETGIRAGHWSVLVDLAASPGFTDEVVQVFLARDLTDIGRQGEISDEEADLKIVRVALEEAVGAVLDGRIVNGAAIAGVLAVHTIVAGGHALRTGDAGWGPGSVASGDLAAPAVGTVAIEAAPDGAITVTPADSVA